MLAPFTDIGSLGMTGVWRSSVAWGDYDNDGALDVVVTGWMGTQENYGYITRIYHNDGDDTFSELDAGMVGVAAGSVDWGDYDNDGWLDLLITGFSGMGDPEYAWAEGTPVAKVYHNNGDGTFRDIDAGLTGVRVGAASWGDYNNDGRLDILLAGRTYEGNACSKVYRNVGDGEFYDIGADIVGVTEAAAVWGDYDNDGRLDILLSGRNQQGYACTTIYHNDGDEQFSSSSILDAHWRSAAAWGDYDNDGLLDIVLSGMDGSNNPDIAIYHNEGGWFSDTVTTLPGAYGGSVSWGDYDNNGQLDILMTGRGPGGQLTTHVIRNDGAGHFESIHHEMPGEGDGAAAWGDYNNDGRLDVILTGDSDLGWEPRLYRNDGTAVNSAPAAPEDLSATVDSATVELAWTAPLDDRTSPDGLSYVLRVGTAPGGSDVVAPMVVPSTSQRKLAQRGPIQSTGWTLNHLASETTYYWSIQAVDSALAGSPFATEGSFVTPTIHEPPAAWVGTPIGIQMGNVAIAYGLIDANSDVCHIVVEYSPDGGANWFPAAMGVGGDGTEGLSSTAAGQRHTFLWDSFQDLPNTTNLNVVVRIAPNDVDGAGNVATSSRFAIHNPDRTFAEQGTIRIGAVNIRSLAWGDCDNDGRQDLLVTGHTLDWQPVVRIYHNEGDGSFHDTEAIIVGAFEGSAVWADYDNDGWLDMLISGSTPWGERVTKVFHNDGHGGFADVSASLLGVLDSSVAWGDYDNDGRLDILLSGRDSSYAVVTRIYHNEGDSTFRDIAAGLSGVAEGTVSWGDYDNDGRLDALITGGCTKVYHNDGNDVFRDVVTTLPDGMFGSAAWGDYDSDGWLDVLVVGYFPDGGTYGQRFARILHNEGNGSFCDVDAGLPNSLGKAVWGDYDNDGRLDVLIVGEDLAGDAFADVYHNAGANTFQSIVAPLPQLSGHPAWVDYDNDGRLDIACATTSASEAEIKLFRNVNPVTNAAPHSPTNLNESVTSSTANLSWEEAEDDHAQSTALNYNLRVGTTRGGSDVVGPMADAADGSRRLTERGAVQTTTWTLHSLVPGTTYYWSVQAVDTAFAGSPFAEERSFTTPLSSLVLAAMESDPLTIAVGDPGTAITASTQVTDQEGLGVTEAIIRVVDNYQRDQDVLEFTNTAQITGTWDAEKGTLTLSGWDTAASYQAALQSVIFRNTNEIPSRVVRRVSFQIGAAATISNVVSRQVRIVDAISGWVYWDQDGDARLDSESGESGLAGCTVYLDSNDNGILDAAEPTTTTTVDGRYRFTDVLPGSYLVRQAMDPGYIRTWPAADRYVATVQSGVEPVDYVFLDTAITSISGTAYRDVNGDGQRGPFVAPLGGELMAHQNAAGRQDAQSSLTTMASDAAGNFVIVWMFDPAGPAVSRNEIVGRRFDALGNPRGDEFTVNLPSETNRFSPTVAMNAVGEFVVLWTEVFANDNNARVMARTYDADGVPKGQPVRVDSGSYTIQGDPIAGIDASGAFLVVWGGNPQGSSNSTVIARRFGPLGSPLGPEFEPSPGGNLYRSLVRASISMNGDGRCLITWHTGYAWYGFDTYGVLYDASGAVVRDMSFGPGGWVSADMDESGSFLATWTRLGAGDAGWEVYAQRFNALGNAMSPEIHVNTTTCGTQYTSRVASLSGGQFVVVWRDDSGNDGDGYGVFARCFDAGGQPIGGEFVASVTTLGWQAVASVAAGADGDFFVSWTGTGGGDPWCGVLFRRFHMTPLEPGLAGFTIYLDANNNGALDAAETFDVSDVDGQYSLSGAESLPTHVVRAVDPPDWRLSGPVSGFWDTRVTSCDFGFAFSLPTAAVASPKNQQTGDVSIAYTLADTDSDTVDIAVHYSLDGGTSWHPAAPGSGGDGTTGLSVSPGGQTHWFVWNSVADLPGSYNATVIVRIQPIDVNGVGTEDCTDAFAVVNPRLTAEVRIVSSTSSTEHMSEAAFASYSSIANATGDYFAEIWIRDSLAPSGIAGGTVDLSYTTSMTHATSFSHGGVFTALVSGTIDDAAGLVDNLGGATFLENEGTSQWVRLGVVTFHPTGIGDVTLALGYDLPPGTGNASFAEVGMGNIDWNVVRFGNSPVTIHQSPIIARVDIIPRTAPSMTDTSLTKPASDRVPFWVLESDGTPGANSYFIEVWIRSDPESIAAIGGGSVQMNFDPAVARVVAVEHGSVFTTSPICSVDSVSGSLSIGGYTNRADVGDDEYVLLGRIEFQGVAAVDEIAHHAGPYAMGLTATDGPAPFETVDRTKIIAAFASLPTISIKAVIYDIDDNDSVDFGDFSYFVPAFGKPVGVAEPPYVWWADFDGNNSIDFGDFGYFVTAFNRLFNDPGIRFPSNGRGRALSSPDVAELQVELRVVSTPSPTEYLNDADFAAYASITAAPLGATYYAEVWLRDARTIRGIAGGTVDLSYPTAIVDASAVDHGTVFNALTSGVIRDANGLVDNLGGGTFNTGSGTTTWVRLATTSLTASASGLATFTLGHETSPGTVNGRFAEMGAGNLDWSQVDFDHASVAVFQGKVTSNPPTIDTISDREILEDSLESVVPLTGISAGLGENEPIRILATSSPPQVISVPVVLYVSPDSEGSLRFTPLANANGTVVINVTVEDGGLDGDLATLGDNAMTAREFRVVITPVQDVPIATSDDFTVQENQTLTVSSPGVLSNDLEVDGDVMQAVLAQSPTRGTLVLLPNGSFTYTPPTNFNREDCFQYYVDDGTAQSEVVTVTLTVHTAYAWYNGIWAVDVNDDRFVTPLDALLVINDLNVYGARNLSVDRPRPLTGPFFDTSRDGRISPLDALLVINFLNSRGQGEGECDGADSSVATSRRIDSTVANASPQHVAQTADPMVSWIDNRLRRIAHDITCGEPGTEPKTPVDGGPVTIEPAGYRTRLDDTLPASHVRRALDQLFAELDELIPSQNPSELVLDRSAHTLRPPRSTGK